MASNATRLGIIIASSMALAACADRSRPAPNPTVRLSPLSTRSSGGVVASRLVDRDTTAPVSVDATAVVTLDFGHEVAIERVKVHGATSISVRIAGASFGSPDAAGWAEATLASPAIVRELTVTLEPSGTGAELKEIEAWGAGRPLAPRSVEALAQRSGTGTDETYENAWVLRPDVAAASLQPPGAGEGSSCLRTHFPAFDPRQARRAYLAFEANVPRAVALQHSFGGGAPQDGFWLGTTPGAKAHLDEIDPASLVGGDDLLLCLPAEADGAVDVTGLRLLLLLDDGTAAFDRDTFQRVAAGIDGDAATEVGLPGGATRFMLDRAVDVEAARIRVGRGTSRIERVGAFDGASWNDLGPIDLDELAGELPVRGTTSAIELTFPGAARLDAPSAILADLSVTGSPVGARVGEPRIVLAYPAVTRRAGREEGERFGTRAFLSGWAESPFGAGTVDVDGAPVDVDGAFSVPLERPLGSAGSWQVTLTARFPDGSEVVRTIDLDDDHEAELLGAGNGSSTGTDDQRFGRESQTGWGRIDAATGGKVRLGTDVSIEAPAGAVSAATQIGITRKGRETIPPLEAGMINVTAPAHGGYRFTPRGQQFAKPVKVTIPYDPALLPEGVAPEEVQTYFFDEAQERWQTLPRKSVLRDTRQVVSETTHFTFMINAVLVLPDHPGPVSFNPNSIKDLKAADPSAGIDLIEPPQGNNQGSARLGFPIRLPKARGAHQPAVGLTYDSIAGNGWVGVGWDLATPRVTIDTRYGVPEYGGQERYLLDGQQLVPVDPPVSIPPALPPPPPACLDGTTARRYHARVESAFLAILRCGSSPANYWFQVIDKAGTLYVYGRQETARLTSYLPRVTVPPVFPQVFDVAEWYLERVVDANGNLTQYAYQHDSRAPGELVHRETYRQVYLRSIQYTGTATSRRTAAALVGGAAGPYLVEFQHAPGIRADELASARTGFKTVMRRRLGTVQVRLLSGTPAGLIRSYDLVYETGALEKSRLKEIVVRGTGGQHFYSHSFDYEELPTSQGGVTLFGDPTQWNLDGDSRAGLSASDEWAFGFHGFVGLGASWKKNVATIGVGFGYGQRRSTTKAAFVDMNGDGLPDRVSDADWFDDLLGIEPAGILFNRGAGRALTALPPEWDPAAPLGGAVGTGLGTKKLGKEIGHSFDASLQAFLGPVSANFGAAYNLSNSEDFIVDANGDGLPDLVSKGKVYFNQARATTCPANTGTATCCPAGTFCFGQGLATPLSAIDPVEMDALEDLGDSEDLVANDPTAAQATEAMAEALTPEDAVIEWTAPYTGAVDISGVLQFANPTANGERRDGVRLRVFTYNPFPADSHPAEIPGGTFIKSPGDASPTPVRLGGVQVSRGHLIYFVLSTLSDFPMRATNGALSPVEQVSFAPVIAYRGVAAKDRDLRDPTGAYMHRFDAQQDFVLGGQPQGSIALPVDGRVALTAKLTKLASSDGVRVCVQYYPPPADDETNLQIQSGPCGADPGGANGGDIYNASLTAAETANDLTITIPAQDVISGGTLFVRVDTDLAIDPRSVSFQVSGTYDCVTTLAGCLTPSEDDAPKLAFDAITYAPLHENVSRYAERWEPPTEQLTPFVAEADGTFYFNSYARHADNDVPVYFSIRTPNRQLLKAAGNHGEEVVLPVMPEGSDYTHSVSLKKGDQVFFEAHSERRESLDYGWDSARQSTRSITWEVSCRFERADDLPTNEACAPTLSFTTDRHSNGWSAGNQPALSGGYHGWRYGAWHGRDDETFEGWVFRGEPKSTSDASWEDAEAVDSQKEAMKNAEDPRRKRLRLLGLLVPSAHGTRIRPDQPGFEPAGAAYVSQDGNTYFTAGKIHAGKKGESASEETLDPEEQPVTVTKMAIGKVGRSSASVSVSAGLSLGNSLISIGGGIGAGVTQQKLDVADMNGDGFVDVIAAGGIPNILDFDFNGFKSLIDGDVKTRVRMTSPVSMATTRTVQVQGIPMLSFDLQGQVNVGLTPATRNLRADGTDRGGKALFPGFGGGASFSVNSVVQQIVDMNGDGLGDMVRRSTNSAQCDGVWVRLNMGTSFAATDDCVATNADGFFADSFVASLAPSGGGGILGGVTGERPIRRSKSITFQGNSSLGTLAVIPSGLKGGHPSSESWGFSVSAESSIAATNMAMMDVTGDGLPDYIAKANGGNDFKVRVNTGFGFGPVRTWHPRSSWGANIQQPRIHLGAPESVLTLLRGFLGSNVITGVDPLEATGTHSLLPNIGVSVNFAWPIWGIIPAPPYLHVGGGTNVTLRRVSGFELGLQDIDGDGFVDHVLKTDGNAPIWARLNQLGKVNLLKRVVRPLGGSIDLAYEQRVGNTVAMPGSRWVLTGVTARDGRAATPGAVGHDLTTSWAYANGHHDRYEREFLGFASVTRTNPDGSTVEQTWDNSSFVRKGLLLSELMKDGSGHKWVETVNTWSDPYGVGAPAEACMLVTPVKLPRADYCGSFFNKLEQSDKRFFEGQALPGITTRQSFTYNATGDVITFNDDGDLADPADDLVATIVYANDTAATQLRSISRPESVDVRAPGGATSLRYRYAEYDDDGNPELFRALIASGQFAETNLTWYPNGTLQSAEGPPNSTGQRYQTTYGYDGTTGTYITAITDSHGYASTATYDLRFGEALTTTDLNGNVTGRRLDAFGRLERLAGPYDTLDNPTVWIAYSHGATTPYARTRNKLPRALGDTRGTVDTVISIDGLGRVIQTKKTAEIATSQSSKGLGWSVTGHQVFDVMGRVELQGQTFGQFSQRPEFVPGNPRNPTRFVYDPLGRMIETLEPNNAITRVQYGFGAHPGSGLTRFKTVTTDAEGHSKAAFKDAGDRIVAVEERIDGRTPLTRYLYNRTGELTGVIDAANHTTTVTYDLLGRRKSLQNPDTGLIQYDLDPAGNVIKKYDPNLALGNQYIEYLYDFDQLTDIHYPNPARDVHYTYGEAGAATPANGVGRVLEVEDAAGKEQRTYGKLGEVTSTTRILRPILPGDRERTFTTAFTFDSFGRMMSITYPDGETVKYGYDAGGLLESAVGSRNLGGVVQVEPYLTSLMYDAFGQRVRMELGNSVHTSYSYEPLTRRLHTLTTTTPTSRRLQAITYGYDRVGNITTMVNALGEPVGDRSGAVAFQYRYDDLYRLTWAHGEARSRVGTIDRFTAQYAYSDIHNMTSNVQLHEIVRGDASGVTAERPPKTNHEFAYTYGNTAPHQATRIGETLLVYDANGNTVKECRDHGSASCDVSADQLRTYSWTEENRLDHVVDGGGKNITRFLYDAGGDRVVKLGRGGESITIGQFWSLKGRRAATKHVFAGSSRLASKLLPPPGWTTTTTSATGSAANPVGDGLPNETGCEAANYNPQKCPELPGGTPVINHFYDDTKVRPETYYYHPDHLGSTSWVTDQSGRVHEHVEYFPYGEVWRDPRSDTDAGPVKGQRFLFTGKELDEETGLVYFGARYYDPRWAIWKSVDPSAADIVTSIDDGSSLNLFAYVRWRPLYAIDPDGRSDVPAFMGPIDPNRARQMREMTTEELSERRAEAFRLRLEPPPPPDGPVQKFQKAAGETAQALAAKSLDESLSPEAQALAAFQGAVTGLFDPDHMDLTYNLTVGIVSPRRSPGARAGAGGGRGGAIGTTPRVSSRVLRRLWELAKGKVWPKDTATGRNQDVAHKKALADKGTNSVRNIEPKPHAEHVKEHSDNGDYRRWGARSGGGNRGSTE